MTDSDVLFGSRLRLFDLAHDAGVSQACRTFGVQRWQLRRWQQRRWQPVHACS